MHRGGQVLNYQLHRQKYPMVIIMPKGRREKSGCPQTIANEIGSHPEIHYRTVSKIIKRSEGN